MVAAKELELTKVGVGVRLQANQAKDVTKGDNYV